MQSGFLITDKKDIFYHTKFSGSNGFVIKIDNKTFLFTDPRYTNAATQLISKKLKVVIVKNRKQLESFQNKHQLSSLTFQESIPYQKYLDFKRIFKNTKFIRSKGSISKCRTIKQGWELDLLKKSQELNQLTLNQTIKDLQIGITEMELANRIRLHALSNGCPQLSFDPIVAFGENSANIHHSPSNRKLKSTDVILIDMGVEYQNYQSDMSRTFLPKNPSKQLQADYQKVLDAHLHGIKQAHHGKSIKRLDQECRNILSPDLMEHSLGHGIGLDVHELPYLGSKTKQKLETNMAITIEPGIYKTNQYGIRIEDVVIVQKTQGHSISTQNKDISAVIWN